MDLVKEVYLITKNLPNSEKFGLTSQINRCAVSIPSNIAEGQQRNNKAEFRQFIGIARGSAAELDTQLILIEYIFDIDTELVRNQLNEIQRMLTVLSTRLK
jgi:four helix bundle protein